MTENQIDLTGKTVLIADDDYISTEMTTAILAKRGINSDAVHNGEEAVKKYNKSAPFFYDAVIMDIQMPVMGGVEAVEIIRGLPREDAASVPIIALTATAPSDIPKNFSSFVIKPINIKAFFEILENLL